MYAEDAQESQQDPACVVVVTSASETPVGGGVHARDQKEVNHPSDAQESEGEKPKRPRLGFAVIETVRAHETENPEQVTDRF